MSTLHHTSEINTYICNSCNCASETLEVYYQTY